MGAQEDADERVAWVRRRGLRWLQRAVLATKDAQTDSLAEQKQEARKYLLEDVKQAISSAQLELEHIDFLWGRIRLSRLTITPAIKADVRVEVWAA